MKSRLKTGVTAATLAIAAAATLGAAPATAEGKARPTDRLDRGASPQRMLTDRAEAPSTSATAVEGEGVPVYRVAGKDRVGTSIAASQGVFWDATSTDENAWKADAVVVSRADFYADALGGTPLAGAANGPLLLTPSAALHSGVKAEIDRVLGGTGTVYLLGGTGALSLAVEDALVAGGYDVVRLAGADRFSTSVRVAQEVETIIGRVPDPVLVTTGLNFPDGLAAGTTAAAYRGVVVLSKDDEIPSGVADYLARVSNDANPWIEAVGGQAGAAPFDWDYVTSGSSRYETAAILAREWWAIPDWEPATPKAVGMTTGLNWPDALSGGAFMAGWGPLVLSRTDSVPATTLDATVTIATQSEPTPLKWGFVFGGSAVVSDAAVWQFVDALNS